MADRTLLQHLLVNLVGNAVKYTLPGERPSVTIRSFSGGDRGWVRLYIVDAGIGIPEGEEAAIFEPFRRASTVKDTYEGSGPGPGAVQAHRASSRRPDQRPAQRGSRHHDHRDAPPRLTARRQRGPPLRRLRA